MDANEVIARQQIKIEQMKDKLEDYESRLKEIHFMLVCCGGPLNDNYYQYNKDQLKIFFKIDGLADIYDGDEEHY